MYEAYRSILGVRLTLLPPLKPLRKIEQPICQPEADEEPEAGHAAGPFAIDAR